MPRVEERILTAFSEKDARRIVNACKTPRDTAIVLCLLDTGCRAREFISLNVEDVDLQTGAVIVLHGKGRKERTVYLGQKARKALSRYLASRPRPRPQDPLWASQGPNRDPNNERLSVWGLQQMLRRIGRHSGVPNCHPHTFRRTFALWSLRAGMNIYALQQLMGHADLTILRHYLPLVESDLRQAHEQFGAVDQWL